MIERIAVAYSGGKDSTLMLHRLLHDDRYQVVTLITTLAGPERRSTSHMVPESLLDAQAVALGLPLRKIIMANFTGEAFEKGMIEVMAELGLLGVSKIAYGDLHLMDVRVYKEKLMAPYGFELLLPLWGEPAEHLVREFIDRGYRAVLICVDSTQLDPRFLGRTIDHDLLAELPPEVDPCGENGEYHSFAFDGPLFLAPVPFVVPEGSTVVQDRWHYKSITPAT
jgi:uncharacterized protein (TIGR00290 family)